MTELAAGTPEKVRVAIIEPHEVFRAGMCVSLESDGFEIVESVGSMRQMGSTECDVAIAGMPEVLLEELFDRLGPSARIVATFLAPTSRDVAGAMESNVAAVLIYPEITPWTLAATVRMVAGGATTMPRALVQQALQSATRRSAVRDWLDERDLQVLSALSEGSSTKEIASQLAYSERTIKYVVHAMLAKLNCRNRTQAVAVAAREGII